ncbi:MAG TPA: O-antigen ligase family protein, partial [Patescibacteria group bacterium]|nr:O-antigen ligase family protein [Patescibacteria group bacterium]
TLEILKLVSSKNPTLLRPALAIPGLIFLLALILATLTSSNAHASLFGNYGRFHGGLLSWFAYGVIYFSLVQQTKETYQGIIKVSLASSLLVSGWGILERLGIDASYWEQDVQARVFSTLGQPNWLAAYLAMLIPWAATFYLNARARASTIGLLGLIVLLYTCFIFTYSRGGNYGLAAGIAVYLVVLSWSGIRSYWKKLLPLGISMAIVTILFATPFATRYFGAPSPRIVENLEAGNETGNIRLIVWQGAWQAFLDQPFLGHGLETFGEAFYKFRPPEMNQTGEWDFLFNRAHNEYLNYLATTGIVGTGSYLLLIAIFGWKARQFLHRSRDNRYFLLIGAAVASMSSYLIQNVFGFTVVPLALLFILNLAGLNLIDGKEIKLKLPVWWSKVRLLQPQLLLFAALAIGIIYITNFWRADLLYVEGSVANDLGQSSQAEFYLEKAVWLNPWEPSYLIGLSFAKASLAQDLGPTPPGFKLAEDSVQLANRATGTSPRNLTLWRIKTQIFEMVAEVDKKYLPDVERSLLKEIELAPTEPRMYLGAAKFYEKNGDQVQALSYYLKANSLKPEWLPPLLGLAQLYLDLGETEKAKLYLRQAQKISPEDPEVRNLSQKAVL